MHTILVVDADNESQDLIRQLLSREGYSVVGVSTARDALLYLEHTLPSLALINCKLPVMDGLTLCRRLRGGARTNALPVIFLSDSGLSSDVAKALEAGGDDFVRKPFAPRELSARVRAQLRRTAVNMAQDDQPTLTIVPHSLAVLVNERRVALTQVEFELMMFLCNTPNQLHSTESLLTSVWRYPKGAGDAALVRNHIRNLRRKIESDPERPTIILSRHGRGYTIKARVQVDHQSFGGGH